MIPLRLRLRNFLSYRETHEPLEFDSFRLACLSGDNGHGKSALLDAITWAFWGRSRAKTEDELFSYGSTEMEVELDFQLGESVFKILRKRSRRASSSIPTLELQIRDGESFRPMTGNSVRDTERAIVRLLHLDYETFVNSAFLLQGKADSFTTKTAGERKQVLAEILSLDVYDRLEEKARALARDRRAQMMAIDVEIARIDEELAKKPEYQADIQRFELEARDLSRRLEMLSLELQLGLSEMEKLNATAERAKALSKAIAEDRMRLTNQQRRREGLEQRLRSAQSLIDQRKEIEAGFDALCRAQAVYREQSERVAVLGPLVTQREALNRKIEARRATIQAEIKSLSDRVDLLNKQAGDAQGLKLALAEAETEQAAAEKSRRELEQRRSRLNDDSKRISEDGGRLEGLKREMNEIKQSIDLLGDSPICPVCSQTLSERDRTALLELRNSQGKQKGDEYRAVKKRVDEGKKLLAEQTGKLEADDIALKAREARAAIGVGKLRQQAADAEKAVAESSQAAIALKESESHLQSNTYAAAEIEALAALDAKIEMQPVDYPALDAARVSMNELEPFAEKRRQLLGALEQIETNHSDLDFCVKEISALEGQIEQNSKELGTVPVSEDARATLERKILGIREQQSQLTTIRNTAENHLGRAQQQLDYCLRLEQERAEKITSQKQAASDRSTYEELATAFGKRGVQAMIIESFLPEIEQDANEILQRMTDNRMTIRLETQRTGKTNNSIETLDILIGDELGTRNYEMFSGGEAFRINFAIRVALAKSLTRRAGAKLETLVIDEGFGTQDAAGRDRLVEAIHAIEEEFEKIIVVTHIDELKEVFPTRINVVKTVDGSSFSITHR